MVNVLVFPARVKRATAKGTIRLMRRKASIFLFIEKVTDVLYLYPSLDSFYIRRGYRRKILSIFLRVINI